MTTERKHIPEGEYFCTQITLTLPEIAPFSAKAVGPLYAAAAQLGLEITGPNEFMYTPADDGKFLLEVGIPVKEQHGTSGDYYYKRSPAYECVAHSYIGPMTGINAAWQEFGEAAGAEGEKISPEFREVYQHWVSFDSPENVTELRVMLAE